MAGLALLAAVLAGCGAHVHHIVRENETLYSVSFRYGQDFRDVAHWNGLEEPYVISPGQALRIIPPAREPRMSASGAAPAVGSGTVGGGTDRQGASPPQSSAAGAAGTAETIALDTPAPAVVISDPTRTAPVPVTPAPASRPPPSASQTPPPPAAGPRAETGRTAAPPVRSQATTAGGTPAWSWPVSGAGTRSDLTIKPSRRGLEVSAARGEPVRAAAAGRVVYGGAGIPHYGNLLIIKHSDRYLSAYAHNDRLLVGEGDEVAAGQQIAEMGDSGAGAGGVRLHFEIREDGEPVDPMRFLPAR